MVSSSISLSRSTKFKLCDEWGEWYRGIGDDPSDPAAGYLPYDIRGRGTYVNGTCLARKVREGVREEARALPHLHHTTQPHHAAGGGGDGYQERGCEVACYGRVDADNRQSGVATRAFCVRRLRCPRVQFVRHPVQVWFARRDTGGTRRTLTCYVTRQDIPRRTAVTARKVYRDTESATTA